MKRHPAVSSHEQPRPVIVVALLEDDALAACGVARYAVQLDSCVRCCDPGETGISVDLECRFADGKRRTVTMRDVVHRGRLGTECLTDYGGVKFVEVRGLFCHR